MLLRHSFIGIYTAAFILVQSFFAHTTQIHIYTAYTWRTPICSLPLAVAPLHPFVPPFTYLAPSSCDRNRPPPSQVACKLTPLAPPFSPLTHPSQIPRTPPARAYNDDLGNILALGVQNIYL
jgi:hypothetical protein